jgi:hypothetical protein
MPEKTERDYTPYLIAGGVGALGVGAWLMFRSKGGVKPGGEVEAEFKCDYYGSGGLYIMQVSIGIIRLGIFDHLEGMTWEREFEISVYDKNGVELERPIKVREKMSFDLPMGTRPNVSYDAECGIRLPGSSQFSFIEGTRLLIDNAIYVEEKK